MYWWQELYYQSTNKYNFLTAANQIGKSNVQVRKCIEWATNKSLWPKLWSKKPQAFFYFYPARAMATMEFENKWIPELLPRGDARESDVYGWKAEYKNGEIHSIHFNSGVSVYFRSYGSDAQNLQASSPNAIFCDEELPVEIFAELNLRLASCGGVGDGRGYWHMVFTATLGQEFWRETIEGDRFPDALKLQISMYDCLEFTNGKPGLYTVEKIEAIKATLPNEATVQMRIYGKFILVDGLLFDKFDFARHFNPAPTGVDPSWLIYSGIDPGGGGKSHPGSIVFLAVKPDFTCGKYFKAWKGNKFETTTAGDILKIYMEMRKGLNLIGEYYDHQAKDFGTLATRAGIPIQKADKSREHGIPLMNTLFGADALTIDADDEGHCLALADELSKLKAAHVAKYKRHSKDDLADGARYATSSVPWALEGLVPVNAQATTKQEHKYQRGIPSEVSITEEYNEEVNLFNSLIEDY